MEAVVLIVLGVVWLVIQLAKDASWHTNAFDGKKYDIDAAWNDAVCKGISKSEFKKNRRNGKYSK